MYQINFWKTTCAIRFNWYQSRDVRQKDLLSKVVISLMLNSSYKSPIEKVTLCFGPVVLEISISPIAFIFSFFLCSTMAKQLDDLFGSVQDLPDVKPPLPSVSSSSAGKSAGGGGLMPLLQRHLLVHQHPLIQFLREYYILHLQKNLNIVWV